MRIVFPDGAGCVQRRTDLAALERLGPVDFYDGPPPDRATLIDRLRPAEVVVLDYSTLDADVLAAAERLKLITFLGIGYASYIDVEAATKRRITIAYTPDYGATTVAEYALGMILALTRHIGSAFVSFRDRKWESGRFQGMELQGKTLGLVGLGPIGEEVARLATAIGMRVIAWTRRSAPERAVHGLELVALDEVFARSDVVSLHLAYRAETDRIITRALLERMRPGAWFVNTARAKLVDNAALADLLRSGRIAGAAIDVHEEEPPREPYLFRDVPNVLATPHIGYNTAEASANMLRIAIATVEAFARGERLHVVNDV